ncbi:MAG TPA: hypothetical protein PKD37_04850 [Oligoflexia bacterium]|nr:hypothetical protein [Oligoflexia bacterium]HMP27294.1 hypothetical protein [Oligoflexia bacterium]
MKIRNLPLFFTVILSFLLLGIEDLFCQPKDPKKFYPQDYVNDPLSKRDVKLKEGSNKSKTIEKKDSALTSDSREAENIIDFSNYFDQQQNREEEKQEEGSLVQQAGDKKKVLAVGLIVNSLDKEHLRLVLSDLVEAAVSNDLTIGDVYAIGNIGNLISLRESSQLAAREGWIRAVSEVPPKYAAVKTSPTYIIHTPEGEILIEGLIKRPLKALFDGAGNISLPENAG